MDNSGGADKSREKTRQDALRQSIRKASRHPYITRQHPGGDVDSVASQDRACPEAGDEGPATEEGPQTDEENPG